MKTKALYLFLGMSAALALGACSDNDMAVNGGEQGSTLTDGKAYMVVRISDVGAGAMTKATSPTEKDGFEYGGDEEHAIANAHFYFYDASGAFVTESVATNLTGNDGTTNNVEYKTNAVVVLQDLTDTSYPTCMVTVLNKPDYFTAPQSLTDFEAALANGTVEGGIQDSSNNYTMSTSSYTGDTTRDKYFVTEINEGNFSLQPIEYDSDGVTPTNCTPVTVYVERLAAKVTLDVDDALTSTTIDGVSGKVYKITHEVESDTELSTPTDLYVSIDGWKLNATARWSYMVKNIDEEWTNTETTLGTSWSWNDADNFRSYWGKSYNYDVDVDYPTTSAGNYDNDEAAASTTQLNDYLAYTSLLSPNELGAYEYCGENTNTAGDDGVLTSKNSSAITSILVKATLYDESGNTPTFVKHDGLLYPITEDSDPYAAYVLNHINSRGLLNVYYNAAGEDEEPDYVQIDKSYVHTSAENDVDGYCRVALTDAAKEITFYSLAYDDDGNVTATAIDDVQAILDDNFNDTYGTDANYYNEGKMYYNIPIEHLNNNYDVQTDYDANRAEIEVLNMAEANYGVVRNHLYKVTITELQNLGRGIYDPNEVIIPQEEEDNYYIGAQVNILSWKVVEQDVVL